MIYFASDFHLGTDGLVSSVEREKRIVRWLSTIQEEVTELYLVGDVFDYWFEYGSVIPKGFTRLLGKLAELTDGGVKVYFFTGNHDMWMFNYLTDEMGIPIYREPIVKNIQGKNFYIGHGDGLGPGDHRYKFLKNILGNKLCQWTFARLHPNFGIKLMRYCSRKSRASQESAVFLGKEKEWLISFVEDHAKDHNIDYYVFGHRHLFLEYHVQNSNAIYFNLGDWLTYQSYLVFDGNKATLKSFNTTYEPIII